MQQCTPRNAFTYSAIGLAIMVFSATDVFSGLFWLSVIVFFAGICFLGIGIDYFKALKDNEQQ